MKAFQCSLPLLLVIVYVHMCIALPSERIKRQADAVASVQANSKDVDSELNPINAEDTAAIEDLERNKRKLPDATFEAKNALLGFVFGNKWDDVKKSIFRKQRAVVATGKDDTPEFDRTNVSLDFPDELFNKSFSTLTNVSKTVSRLIMNSARRYSRFMLFFKPIFGDALEVRGYEDPTTTTTTSTTENPISNTIE